jgi:hypothetical protein
MSDSTPTSSLEKWFLVSAIVALPTENHFLFIPGFSLLFVLFGTIALYTVLTRFSELLRTMFHPAFLATYAFLGYGFVMEWTHDNYSYFELTRMAQMIVGAVLIATLCRDLPALNMACYGYLGAGLWLSVLLFMTSYGALNAANTSSFQEASLLRAAAFEDNPLQSNLNSMAFGAGQAAVVALAWALMTHETLPRMLYTGAGVFCMIGAFLPLSRGGVVITFAACASVMYAFGLRHGKVILIALFLGCAIAMWVPQSVWSRMSFSFDEREGKVEGRALVYGAAMENIPDYLFTGVGAGNFWTEWGRRTAFVSGTGRVSGSHNCFLQVMLYWGLFGLLTFLLVFWQAYRCIPKWCHREAAALSLVGISVSLFLYAMVIHNMYAKEFSFGLGLLVGAHQWIWPEGIVYSTSGVQKAIPRFALG